MLVLVLIRVASRTAYNAIFVYYKSICTMLFKIWKKRGAREKKNITSYFLFPCSRRCNDCNDTLKYEQLMHTHIGSKKIAIAKCIYRFNSISRSIHRLLRLYTLILRSSSRSSSVCAVWIFCSVFSHSNFIFMLLSLLMEFRFAPCILNYTPFLVRVTINLANLWTTPCTCTFSSVQIVLSSL